MSLLLLRVHTWLREWCPGLWLGLLVGLALKAVILLTRSITFDADEAIVGLMARHIMQGERPVFFYGQSYMGALDAYLTVPLFAIFGPTVAAMRLLQVILYAAVVITSYHAALRVAGDKFAAATTAMLIAVPPVLFSLYTSSTLGNYVEILLFNNLLLVIGWDILSGRKEAGGWWFAAGLVGGLGWWSMGLIIVSLLPLLIVGAHYLRKDIPWPKVLVALAGFFMGAAPWLYATATRGPGATMSDLAGSWFSGPSGLRDRILGLVLFNIPALFGLRPPWSVEWIALPIGLVIASLYLFILWTMLSAATRSSANVNGIMAVRTLTLGWAVLLAVFLATPFGGDPTGRYLLPLWPYLAILVGNWLARVRSSPTWWGPTLPYIILAVCLSYNLLGNLRAMIESPPGLTKQFDPISQIPQDYDTELIQFLNDIGADRGYSNYWISYRFAFLTGEQIIFSPRLPYKADLSYTYGDDRYAPYSRAVAAAARVVYVTSNLPLLDGTITQRLVALGVTFRREDIGPYTVFYNLSRKVTPDELGPFGRVTGRAIHDQ